jgi:DNA (cytosine-5)-methyltransferase 1
MKYVSLFSGIEAASEAWKELGFEPVAFSEIEPHASAVLRYHHPDVPNHGDITAFDWSVYHGQVDLVVGGSPCQSFSVAGLRKSLDDDRGNLTLAYVRAVDAIQPGVLLWENVPGVLTTRDNAFGCFLAALVGADSPLVPPKGLKWTDAGYVVGPSRTAAWRVLDAQYFGLAQRRRRVFLVASPLGGRDPREVLFEWEGVRRDSPPSREAGQEVARSLTSSTGGASAKEQQYTFIGEGNRPLNALGAYWDGSDVADTLDASISAKQQMMPEKRRFNAVIHPILEAGARTGKSTDDPRAGMGIGGPDDPMFTLQAGKQHAIGVSLRGREGGGTAELSGDVSPAIRSSQGGGDKPYVLAFDTTQITSKENRANPKPGEPCHPIAAGAHPPAIAFNWQNGGGYGEANDGLGITIEGTGPLQRCQTPAVVYGLDEEHNATPEFFGTLKARTEGGGFEGSVMLPNYAVRRLLPVECERLQGFSDTHTLHARREDGWVYQQSDSQRYKQLGNSFAVAVVRWIGRRIAEVRP